MAGAAKSWEEKKHLLLAKKADLMSKIKLSPLFWSVLVKHRVLQDIEADAIKHRKQTSDTEQISELVDHLIRGPAECYQGFVETLFETGQGFIVSQILGEKTKESGMVGELRADKRLLLISKAAALKNNIQVTHKFWDALMQNHVLSQFEVECFEEASNMEEQIHDLLEYLKTGTNRTYRGFLYALSETDQRQIVIDILGEDVPDLSTEALSQDDDDTMLSFERNEFLEQKAPELIQKVIPTPALWASLIKYEVISGVDKEDIITGERTASGQMSELLGYIKTVGHYEGFVCSLIEANQEAILKDILKEDVIMFKKKYALKGPFIAHRILYDAVKNMKDYFLEKRFHSALLEFSPCSENVRLDNIYTSLHIVKKGNTTRESSHIEEKLVLENMTDEPVQALCVGEAGCGKTTLAKRLIWLWASDKTTSYFWSKIKAVIFVTSEDEDDTFEQTIRNSIPGKEAYKVALMDLIKDEPESVLIIVEAFDDFQNPCVILEMEQMIRNDATNMFVTLRKDHPKLTTKYMSMFNQIYEVNGFFPKGGSTYAEKLLKEMDCQYDVQEFLEAISGKPQFETNPLNLTLACQLYSEGDLKHSDMETLTEVNLYEMREDRMVERECEKHQISKYDGSQEIRKVQNLALYCLVKKRQQCTKSELDNFLIKMDSPAIVLLEKRKKNSLLHGKQEYWVRPHSRLLEFDAVVSISAMKHFEDSLWLYWLGNRSDLNKAAQLLTVILSTAKYYDSIKALTSATIILQSREKCPSTHNPSVDIMHPCEWVTIVKEKVEREITVENCFNKGKCHPIRTMITLPDLRLISKCCGSLYNGNVSLFKHVQNCWKLGLLKENHEDFVKSCNAMLLPGVDRSDDQQVHFMLNHPDDLDLITQAPKPKSVSTVEIHLGLSFGTYVEEENVTQQWVKCLERVLWDFKPYILYVYHNGNNDILSDRVSGMLNMRQYLVQPQKNKWMIWSSDYDMSMGWIRNNDFKTKQVFIPGTTRSGILSMTEENEVAIEIHRIQDVLGIPGGDEYVCTSEIAINVGFWSTTMYHGPQPSETSSEWQSAILYMMTNWTQWTKLLIRSGDSKELEKSMTKEFISSIRNDNGFDVICDKDVEIIKMYNQHTHQTTGGPVLIYTGVNGIIYIRTQSLANVCLIKTTEIDPGDDSEVHIICSDLDPPESIIKELRVCALHILSMTQVKMLQIKFIGDSAHDVSTINNKEFLQWAMAEGYMVDSTSRTVNLNSSKVLPRVPERQGLYATMTRHGNGFRNVRDPISSRSVIVYTAEGTAAVVWASEPGDCKLLNRNHIQCIIKDDLTVRFDVAYESDHTAGHHEALEDEWHDAIQHLLLTYQPTELSIYFGSFRPDIQQIFTLNLPDGRAYTGILTKNKNRLRLFWHGNGFKHVKDPDTGRSIIFYKVEGSQAEIWASQPSDCKLLHRDPTCPAFDVLNLQLKIPFMHDINGDVQNETLGDWHHAMRHLLRTYQPRQLYVHFGRITPGIHHDLTLDVLDGRAYTELLTQQEDFFQLFWNGEGFENVHDPETNRSILVIKAVGTDAVIWASQPSDCKLLNRNHVCCSELDHLTVRFDVDFMYGINGVAQTETHEEWLAAIRHLLDTYQPRQLSIPFGTIRPEIPECFTVDTPSGRTYSGLLTQNQDLLRLFWHEGFRVVKDPHSKRSIITGRWEGTDAFIWAAQFSDCLLLDKNHVQGDAINELTVRFDVPFMCDVNGAARPETLQKWQLVLHHLLDTFQPTQMDIEFGTIRPEIETSFSVNLQNGRTYSAMLNKNHDFLRLFLQDRGFKHVKDPDSNRSVIVYKAEGTGVVIWASHPNDCKLLQREHIQCATIMTLTVKFYVDFMHDINDPAHYVDVPKEWNDALFHLLCTYQPRQATIEFGTFIPALDKDFTVNIPGGTSYSGIFAKAKLSLFQNICGFRHVKDPDSTRSIIIYSVIANDAMIWASQPSDFKLLDRSHIHCATLDGMVVRFDVSILYDINGVAYHETLVKWHDAIRHLLGTFQPTEVIIELGTVKSGIHSDFTMELQDGRIYSGFPNSKCDVLRFVWHAKGFRHVKDPESKRSIMVCSAEDAEAVILASQPSDCKLLRRHHIQCSTFQDLWVRFDEDIMLHLNGPAQTQTLGEWHDAIWHLIHNFQPQELRIDFGEVRCGLHADFTMEVGSGRTFAGLMTQNRDVLRLFRNGDGFRHIKDLESKRSIIIYKVESTGALVWASHPSDCKLLRRDHILCPAIQNLTVRFNVSFMHEVNGKAQPQKVEEWYDAMEHLLSTYQPRLLAIQFGSIRPQIPMQITLNLTEGPTYSGQWVQEDIFLVFH